MNSVGEKVLTSPTHVGSTGCFVGLYFYVAVLVQHDDQEVGVLRALAKLVVAKS